MSSAVHQMKSASFMPIQTEKYISKNDGKEYLLYKYPSGKRLFFISSNNGVLKYYTGANSKDEAIERLEEHITEQNATNRNVPVIRFTNVNDDVNSQDLTSTTSHIAKGMLCGTPDENYAKTVLNRLQKGIHHLAEISHFSTIADLIEACAVLEIRGVRKLAERESHCPMEGLEKTLEAMREAYRKKDAKAMAYADVDFHYQLIKAYSNSIVVEIHHALHPLILKYSMKATEDPERQLSFLVEHEAIHAAILERDAAKASELMAIHVFQCMGEWEMWTSR
ncbi:MAG: FCD domain-containing protein [Puniceicoccales bacterium]|jgi:hypothetical protein|nr:FCD domain-containing protein [Puniceicoccales bacterium]